ncbi:MAG TPA: hypothetical protein VEL28_10545 [Candidatus Binatia bacterium]|nr:hypothetical protein [Candidatus Binatia bacterium]
MRVSNFAKLSCGELKQHEIGRKWLDVSAHGLHKAPKGSSYTDKTGSSDGVAKLSLRIGVAGKTKLQLEAAARTFAGSR